MIIAGTGHRPNKIGGYSAQADQLRFDLAHWFLSHTRPASVISGMALGWDMALAEAALALEIPFVAAVPFAGQESMWPLESQERYRALMQRADAVHIVSRGDYSSAKMQRRNEWMVDNCTHVVALWDGSPGGTANCVAYANKVRRDGWNLWAQYVDAAVNLRLSSPEHNRIRP